MGVAAHYAGLTSGHARGFTGLVFVRQKGLPMRFFTPQDLAKLVKMHGDYVSDKEMAKSLGRSVGVIRQKIFHMKLRRRPYVTGYLARGVPPHVEKVLREEGPDAFLRAVRIWRAEEDAEIKRLSREADEEDEAAAMEDVHVIMARNDLTRREKIIACRELGLTLEFTGELFGITRERVRQINDPLYKAKNARNNRIYKRRLRKRRG